jgi:mannose-6-phosphate isomerase-like protein (cupin superfamily)
MKNGISNADVNTWPQRIKSVYQKLIEIGFHIKSYDIERPWGGFIVIQEEDTKKFIKQFFPEYENELVNQDKTLSPKILCVSPGQQLSWQYHHRRSELWKLIGGKAAYKKSFSDTEGPVSILETNQILHLQTEERHRLIGLNEWGIIAEIWIHSDDKFPSDEDDIVRLADDYGR